MLFEPLFFVAGAGVVGVAVLEKLADDYGYGWLGGVIKVLLPIAALAASVYFIEFNPLLHWLGR